ncbi:MAG TPA: bifunctional 4-hydroxy-2-oxoglutarate aldolase/2-dehydro-3-deoxy-phosphogluconate aldolase [Thermoleophilia bacterium]|nr:bifunctional 4-hydroxy-2-oxoglutarate aldolase/2-dehydro-3-deoxy-phosphogluconate aldolase [Thermoleophilia bacterium]
MVTDSSARGLAQSTAGFLAASSLEAFLGALLVVPVVEIGCADDAVPLARALLDAGLPCAEITFRTAAAARAIAAIAAEVPEVRVGAGTVLNVAQAEAALAAGAGFLVAPGFDSAVVALALERGVPIVPGVCTPTEVGLALAQGLSVVKLFPAEAAGGVKYLKALAAPFGGVRFVPTGGISADNLAAYLAVDQVVACGGSWMVKKRLIADHNFDAIRMLATRAREIALAARPVAGLQGDDA